MENTRLLKSIAWSFASSTGIDMDDLYQEASLAYLEAMKTFDPAKGKVTTHLWHCVHNHLKNYIAVEQKHNAISIEEVDIPYSNTSFLDSLTKDAQEIVSIILDKPLEFDMPDWDVERGHQRHYQKQVRSKLTNLLQSQGWQLSKIMKSFNNLQAYYSK